jgi:hypothetical protein
MLSRASPTNVAGCVIVTVVDLVQPYESVTVTVKTPAPRFVAIAVV